MKLHVFLTFYAKFLIIKYPRTYLKKQYEENAKIKVTRPLRPAFHPFFNYKYEISITM